MVSNHASAGYPTGCGGSRDEQTHSPIGDQVGMTPLGGKHPDTPKPTAKSFAPHAATSPRPPALGSRGTWSWRNPKPASPSTALGGSPRVPRAPDQGSAPLTEGQEGMLSPKAAVQQRCTSFPQPRKLPSLQPRHIHHRASATSRPAAGRFI